MGSLVPYAIGGAVIGLLPFVVSAKSTTAESANGTPASLTTRQRRFRCGFAATALNDDWLRFFDQTARRESRYNPNASRTKAHDVAKSEEVAKSVGYLGGINFSGWGFGSRGLFQFLGPIVAVRSGKLRFPADMTVPRMAYDPGIAIAAAVDYARGLMRWNNFAGSWASLNVGWGNPSRMGRASSIAESAQKMEDRAAKLGWARGWAMDSPYTIPQQSHSEMRALAGAAKAYYEAC